MGGQETCIIIPGLKVAFDIGRCPERAVSQDYLFISHAHMDHIVRKHHLCFLTVHVKLSDSNMLMQGVDFSYFPVTGCCPRCWHSS